MKDLEIGTEVIMIQASGVNKIGEVGVITKFDDHGSFRVKTKSSQDDLGNWCSKSNIKVISKQKQIIMKFKVGDKVKINGHYPGSINKRGDIGIIEEIKTTGELARVRVQGRVPSMANWEDVLTLELIEAVTETFEVSKEFILLAYKDACAEWKEKLKDNFPDAFKTRFINVKIGNRFSCSDFTGGEYILSKIDKQFVVLINLENGNRWSDAVRVFDACDITELEFNKICGDRPEKFTKI